MYTLFTDEARHYGGTVEMDRVVEVGQRIADDVEKVVNYHHVHRQYVRPEHLLVRLIKTMGVPLHYPLGQYYEVALARAPSIAIHFRFTMGMNTGNIFKGVFYHGCDEIFISHTREDNIVELLRGWRTMQPVKVLTSPVSNMGYMLPTGAEHNTETGLVVIGINIPALMVMWRGYVEWKQAVTPDQPGIAESFVRQFVIPNMLYSQTDLAIQNRLINLHTGRPMGSALKRNLVYTTDVTDLLDRGLKRVLKRLSTTSMEYPTLLAQIPSVFNDRPYAMPDVAETRYVWWALFTARMKLMEFLWDVGGEPLRRRNGVHVNNLIIDLKRLKRDSVLESRLTPALFEEMKAFEREVLK